MLTRLRRYIKNKITRTKTVIVPIAEPIPEAKILKGRCALITGGSSGIGKAIAAAFIKRGCKVVICGTTTEKLKKAVEDLNSENVKTLQLDVKDIKTIPSKLEEAKKKFPECNIDILVNSAGLTQRGDIWDISEEIFDNIMDVNVKGTFFMSRYMAEYWIKNDIKANILNISSSSALKPAWGPYQMSKWAVKGLTVGLASKLTAHHITVNAIAPGKTATPMMGKERNDDISCTDQPIGRYEMPQEIANIAVVLVSEMGEAIIGDTVYATGGTGIF